MATKHPLRRSCAFCRARKIKCSNETICEACRRQNADCIYDFESSRPKARNGSQDSNRSSPARVRHTEALAQRNQRRSSSASSSPSTPPSNVLEKQLEELGGDVESVASMLEHLFQERQPRHSPSGALSPPTFKPGSTAVKYTGILSLLTQDFVRAVTTQLGSVESQQAEQDLGFIPQSLPQDDTDAMFDSAPPVNSPLSDYGHRQQTQLIDVWYSTHPLSFLVSKTLLLRELRDGTYDGILLATMLADANYSIGGDIAVARGQNLLRWAVAQLRTRPLRPNGENGTGTGTLTTGVSTRMFDGIATTQSLVLLGWNALSSLQPRRSICYLELAGRMASDIRDQITRPTATLGSSRINGVDVIDVEKEIVSYLYWATFSLSLWASIQSGIPSPLPVSKSLTSICLPVSEATSVMIQLDLVSENFSTLQRQKSVIREMWPLAHIASAVAYTTGLPAQPPGPPQKVGASTWNDYSRAGSPGGVQPQYLPDRFNEARTVLAKTANCINQSVTDVPSKSLVMIVYQIIMLHLVFFKSRQGGATISTDALENLFSYTDEVLRLFTDISSRDQDTFAEAPTFHAAFAKVYSLAATTCSQAFELVRTYLGQSIRDVSLRQIYEGKLAVSAQSLLDMVEDDFFSQGLPLRSVRKHIRALAQTSMPPEVRVTAESPRTSHSPMHSSFIPTAIEQSSLTVASPTAESTSSLNFGYLEAGSTVRSSFNSPSSSRRASAPNTSSPFGNTAEGNWQMSDAMFNGPVNPTTGHSAAVGSDMVGLQNMWDNTIPTMMDLDMMAEIPVQQGAWPELCVEVAAAEPHVDPVLFYFSQGVKKGPS